MSCPSCLNLLRFPVNLGCGHSMCKVCILNGDEAERSRYLKGQSSSTHAGKLLSSRMEHHTAHGRMMSSAGANKNAVQVTCRICHAISTFTSEAALVVDTDLQAMVDVLQGTSVASEACMRCDRVEATTSCTECNAKMCDECCNLVHEGALRNHQITTHASGSLDPSLQPKPCDQHGHSHYRKELFCVDCGTFMCVLCVQQLATHKTHNVVTAAEAAAVERKRLVECVHAAETFRSELRATVGQIDAVTDATLHHATEEIQVFEDTMNSLINALAKRRDELVGQAKALCDAEVGGLRDSRDRIFSLATRLNESVAEGNKALRHKSAVAIVTRAREMEDAIKRWDPIVVPSASCPAFSFPNYKDVVGMIARVSVQPAAITAIEAGLDANHLGRTLQFMNERTGGGGVVGGIGGAFNVHQQQSAATFARLTQGHQPVLAMTQVAPSHNPQPLPFPSSGRPPLPTASSSNGNVTLRPAPAPPQQSGLNTTTAAPPPPMSNARSLLNEFEGISPHRGGGSHFLAMGAVAGGPAAPMHQQQQQQGYAGPSSSSASEAAITSALVNTNLVMRSPRTNLTHPSGGVLIEPSAMLPARHQSTQFKFIKSTFGGIQFLNGGRTVASTHTNPTNDPRHVTSWETAMCDTLLTSGRHYYELHMDRYGGSGSGGHNVLVGLVFDGNYGLCDALGEDNNSVALDLGMGTKCIGGNYALPYMRAGLVHEGDVIGVDVNFDKQTLEFYHNGKYMGVAFTGLSRPCYPAVSLIDAQQVTLMFPMQRPL